MKFNLETGLYCVQFGVFLTKFYINYSVLYVLSLIMCERVGNIIARTLRFMHQCFFTPNYIFDNDAYFLDFCAENYPLILYDLNPFEHQ